MTTKEINEMFQQITEWCVGVEYSHPTAVQAAFLVTAITKVIEVLVETVTEIALLRNEMSASTTAIVTELAALRTLLDERLPVPKKPKQ